MVVALRPLPRYEISVVRSSEIRVPEVRRERDRGERERGREREGERERRKLLCARKVPKTAVPTPDMSKGCATLAGSWALKVPTHL